MRPDKTRQVETSWEKLGQNKTKQNVSRLDKKRQDNTVWNYKRQEKAIWEKKRQKQDNIVKFWIIISVWSATDLPQSTNKQFWMVQSR